MCFLGATLRTGPGPGARGRVRARARGPGSSPPLGSSAATAEGRVGGRGTARGMEGGEDDAGA